jgi:hypothetical protein
VERGAEIVGYAYDVEPGPVESVNCSARRVADRETHIKSLFEAEHKGESENTAPGRPRNWRATAWEVHPVTAVEVLPTPR